MAQGGAAAASPGWSWAGAGAGAGADDWALTLLALAVVAATALALHWFGSRRDPEAAGPASAVPGAGPSRAGGTGPALLPGAESPGREEEVRVKAGGLRAQVPVPRGLTGQDSSPWKQGSRPPSSPGRGPGGPPQANHSSGHSVFRPPKLDHLRLGTVVSVWDTVDAASGLWATPVRPSVQAGALGDGSEGGLRKGSSPTASVLALGSGVDGGKSGETGPPAFRESRGSPGSVEGWPWARREVLVTGSFSQASDATRSWPEARQWGHSPLSQGWGATEGGAAVSMGRGRAEEPGGHRTPEERGSGQGQGDPGSSRQPAGRAADQGLGRPPDRERPGSDPCRGPGSQSPPALPRPEPPEYPQPLGSPPTAPRPSGAFPAAPTLPASSSDLPPSWVPPECGNLGSAPPTVPALAPAPAPTLAPTRGPRPASQGPRAALCKGDQGAQDSAGWGNLILMVLRSHPLPRQPPSQGRAPSTHPESPSGPSSFPPSGSRRSGAPPEGAAPSESAGVHPGAGTGSGAEAAPQPQEGSAEAKGVCTPGPSSAAMPRAPPRPCEPTAPSRAAKRDSQPVPRPRKRSPGEAVESAQGIPLAAPERSPRERSPPERSPRERSPREQSPRERSPPERSPRERSPPERSPRERSPPERSPRERSPPERSPRERSPRERSPRERSPPERSPRERSPRERSPRERSPRERSPPERSPRERSPPERSPRERSPRERSPPERSPRERSPRERSPRERSPPERSPPERSPRERSPPERSPPERSPPERSPPERSPGAARGARRGARPSEAQLEARRLLAFLQRPGSWGAAEGAGRPSARAPEPAAAAAWRQRLDLGSCPDALAFARRHGEPGLARAAYALLSDHLLRVLGQPGLYRRLGAAERQRVLSLRTGRGPAVLGVLALPGLYQAGRPGPARGPPGARAPAAPPAPRAPRPHLHVLDPRENAWRPLAPVPDEAPLRGCGLCTMHNYLFLAGGVRGSGARAVCSNRVFCYNPLTDAWGQVRPMRQARAQLKLVALDGQLYAIGGECLYSVERYDPRADAWAARAPLPAGTFPVAHEAVACRGDIYVTGGHLFCRLLRYRPEQDAWDERPYGAGHRRSSDMVALGGFLYRFDLLRGVGAAVTRYNTVTGSWSRAASLPLPRPLPLRCAVLGDTIYCLNHQVTATLVVCEGTARFQAKGLRPFPLGSKDVLCPFTLTLPAAADPQQSALGAGGRG